MLRVTFLKLFLVLVMKYYLIDENLIRIYYQNKILRGNTNEDTVVLKDVVYELDRKTLEVKHAEPMTLNPYVPTVEGYVKWNPIIEDYKKAGRIDRKEYGGPGRAFCSGYICLGKIPSNYIPINKENLVFIYFFDPQEGIVGRTVKVGESNSKVYEKDDKLIIDTRNSDACKGLDVMIGLEKNDDLYWIYPCDASLIIIPKGSCFMFDKNELCY